MISKDGMDEELSEKEKIQLRPKVAQFDAELAQVKTAVDALQNPEGRKANQDVVAEFGGLMNTVHAEMQ